MDKSIKEDFAFLAERVLMQIDEFHERLNQIAFKKCEEINVGDVLHYELMFKLPEKIVLRALVGIGRAVCTQSFDIEFRGNNPNVLCLFSESYRGRKEHLNAFNNVIGLLDNCIKVVPKTRSFSGFKIKNIVLPFIWCKQMKVLNCDFGLRLFLSRKLFGFFMNYQYVMEQCRKNHIQIEKVISYCDVMPEDSFFMQKLKKKKVMGITLQHGFVSASMNIWACSGSYSDYFFADSQHSVEIVREGGYKGKIFNVGSVHYVGKKEFRKRDKIKTETIGVFLNGEQLRETNIDMIQMLQKFCERTKRKLFIKFHPTSEIEDYREFLNEMKEVYGTEISSSDFGEMIDVAIVSFSTTFIGMLNQWVPSLLYIGENDILPFKYVDFLKFRTEEELEELLKKLNMGLFEDKMEQLRNYYCQSENLEEKYKKAFGVLGIN